MDHRYKYRIPTVLIGGIEYGEFDGLNEQDEKCIHAFWNECSKLVKEHNGKHYAIEYEEESQYGCFETPFTEIGYSGDFKNAIVTIIGGEEKKVPCFICGKLINPKHAVVTALFTDYCKRCARKHNIYVRPYKLVSNEDAFKEIEKLQ